MAPLAALALTEASGALTARFGFQPAEVGQGVTIDATARDLTFAGNAIGALDLDALVVDALGAPLVQRRSDRLEPARRRARHRDARRHRRADRRDDDGR